MATPKPSRLNGTLALTPVLALALGAAGCVSFDDLLATDDAGTHATCAAQCRPDAVECFCSDFDGNDVTGGWAFSSAGGGAITATVEDAQSAPNSALMTCPGSTTGDSGSSYVVLKRGVQTTTRSIRLAGSWKLRRYNQSAPGNFEFFSVALGSATRVALGHSFTGDPLVDTDFRIGVTYTDPLGAFVTDVHNVPIPPTNSTRWVRFELDVTFADDATGSVRLSWDGVEVLSLTNVVTTSLDPGGMVTLSASVGGGTLQGLTPALWMLFDDVVVEVY